MKITADLTFQGRQDSSIESTINIIIKEKAGMIPKGEKLYVRPIGYILLYDQSLVLTQRTVSAVSTTTPITIRDSTTTSKPTTTAPAKPCLNEPDFSYVADSKRCDLFYQCVSSMAVPIECQPGKIYKATTCVPEPPGFVCDKA